MYSLHKHTGGGTSAGVQPQAVTENFACLLDSVAAFEPAHLDIHVYHAAGSAAGMTFMSGGDCLHPRQPAGAEASSSCRLSAAGVSMTVVGSAVNPMRTNFHPSQPRTLTIRECALIQVMRLLLLGQLICVH